MFLCQHTAWTETLVNIIDFLSRTYSLILKKKHKKNINNLISKYSQAGGVANLLIGPRHRILSNCPESVKYSQAGGVANLLIGHRHRIISNCLESVKYSQS